MNENTKPQEGGKVLPVLDVNLELKKVGTPPPLPPIQEKRDSMSSKISSRHIAGNHVYNTSNKLVSCQTLASSFQSLVYMEPAATTPNGKLQTQFNRRGSLVGVSEEGNSIWDCADLGDIEGIRRLINLRVDPDIKDKYHVTPLMHAARSGHIDLIKLLIEDHKVDIHSIDARGANAFIHCCYGGEVDVAKALLNAKAKVNSQNCVGDTALVISTEYNHLRMVEFLLDCKADVNIRGSRGLLPVDIAREQKETLKIFRIFAQYQPAGAIRAIVSGGNKEEAEILLSNTLKQINVSAEDITQKANVMWARERVTILGGERWKSSMARRVFYEKLFDHKLTTRDDSRADISVTDCRIHFDIKSKKSGGEGSDYGLAVGAAIFQMIDRRMRKGELKTAVLSSQEMKSEGSKTSMVAKDSVGMSSSRETCDVSWSEPTESWVVTSGDISSPDSKAGNTLITNPLRGIDKDSLFNGLMDTVVRASVWDCSGGMETSTMFSTLMMNYSSVFLIVFSLKEWVTNGSKVKNYLRNSLRQIKQFSQQRKFAIVGVNLEEMERRQGSIITRKFQKDKHRSMMDKKITEIDHEVLELVTSVGPELATEAGGMLFCSLPHVARSNFFSLRMSGTDPTCDQRWISLKKSIFEAVKAIRDKGCPIPVRWIEIWNRLGTVQTEKNTFSVRGTDVSMSSTKGFSSRNSGSEKSATIGTKSGTGPKVSPILSVSKINRFCLQLGVPEFRIGQMLRRFHHLGLLFYVDETIALSKFAVLNPDWIWKILARIQDYRNEAKISGIKLIEGQIRLRTKGVLDPEVWEYIWPAERIKIRQTYIKELMSHLSILYPVSHPRTPEAEMKYLVLPMVPEYIKKLKKNRADSIPTNTEKFSIEFNCPVPHAVFLNLACELLGNIVVYEPDYDTSNQLFSRHTVKFQCKKLNVTMKLAKDVKVDTRSASSRSLHGSFFMHTVFVEIREKENCSRFFQEAKIALDNMAIWPYRGMHHDCYIWTKDGKQNPIRILEGSITPSTGKMHDITHWFTPTAVSRPRSQNDSRHDSPVHPKQISKLDLMSIQPSSYSPLHCPTIRSGSGSVSSKQSHRRQNAQFLQSEAD
ncbi:hypothetical protein AAMO2058_000368100 [Amorphochlora amoebiformis]